jgi:SAM-dependent methyltransferase
MSVPRRLKNIVRGQGALAIPAKLYAATYDRWYERRNRLNTLAVAKLDGLTIHVGDRAHGFYYEGMRVLPLRRLFAEFRKLVPADAAFVDLGCGKGKVLLVAAESGIGKIRGVEFAHELCEIARANWAAYQARKRPPCVVEVIENDAAAYRFQRDEQLFFMFNPFDESVLDRVLANLSLSIAQRPRRAYVAVAHLSDRYRRVFAAHSEYALDRELDAWGCRFTLFATGPAGSTGPIGATKASAPAS